MYNYFISNSIDKQTIDKFCLKYLVQKNIFRQPCVGLQCCPTGKPGRQYYDLISHSVTLS